MQHRSALLAIVLINFVSISGFGFLLPVFAIYGEHIGASGTEIAWAIAAFSLGQFLVGPLWGKLSDRFGRRPVLIISLLIAAFFFVLSAFATTPLMLILSRFAAGFGSGSFPVAFAVASDISTPKTRTRVMGIVSAGFSLGFILGPAIGGLTAGNDPAPEAFARVCFVGGGITLLAAIIAFFLLPETKTQQKAQSAATMGDIWKVLKRTEFLAPTLLGFVVISALAMMEAVMALFADNVLEQGPLGIGLIFAFMGIVGATTQLALSGWLSRKLGEKKMLIGAICSLAVGLVIIGHSTTIETALIGVLLTAGGFSLVTPAVSSLASIAAPVAMQGVALGVVQSASSLGRIIGPGSSGPIYDYYGPSAPFFFGAVILAFAAISALIFLDKRSIAELTSEAELSPAFKAGE